MPSPTATALAALALASPPRRIRVLVVDDSVVLRRLVTRILEEDPVFEVVGFAANGAIALDREALLRPDVITMDIEMPVMDGPSTVRALRARGSRAKIILCGSLTAHGASSTITTLMVGADDSVTKLPTGPDADNGLRAELIAKIKQFFPAQVAGAPRTPPSPSAPPSPTLPEPKPLAATGRPLAKSARTAQVEIVAIGVSTGGPTALTDLLPCLGASFPVPIVVVQHMPPVFTGQLAAQLAARCEMEVLEAVEGMTLEAGRVVIAPGDFHMSLRRSGKQTRVALDRGERENSCRPSVDVLFRSVGEIFGGHALGLILTGMGQDGLLGVEDLRRRGAYIIAQDQASSVVWGMPGAVVAAGLANAVLSLHEIAPAILKKVQPR